MPEQEPPPAADESRLPENAFRKLRPGETYVPVVPPGRAVPEV